MSQVIIYCCIAFFVILTSTVEHQWSFGIVLWELQSLAARPYNEIDDFEMAEYLTDGFRFSQPVNCPDHL